jgi:hypothetical protein
MRSFPLLRIANISLTLYAERVGFPVKSLAPIGPICHGFMSLDQSIAQVSPDSNPLIWPMDW